MGKGGSLVAGGIYLILKIKGAIDYDIDAASR